MKPVIYQLVVRYFGNTNRTNALDGTGAGTTGDPRVVQVRLHRANVTTMVLSTDGIPSRAGTWNLRYCPALKPISRSSSMRTGWTERTTNGSVTNSSASATAACVKAMSITKCACAWTPITSWWR